MAKHRKSRKSSRKARKSRKASKHHGKTLASPGFGGRKFLCSGKKVRSGKSSKKTARVFCRVNKKK